MSDQAAVKHSVFLAKSVSQEIQTQYLKKTGSASGAIQAVLSRGADLALQEMVAASHGETGGPRPAKPAMPATIPSQLADNDAWTVQNIIEILQNKPQGAAFRVLYATLEIAVSEWRKVGSKVAAQGPGKHAHQRRKKAG